MAWKDIKNDWNVFIKSPLYEKSASDESKFDIIFYTGCIIFFSLTSYGEFHINPFILWILGIFLLSVLYTMPLFLLRSFLIIVMMRTEFNPPFIVFFKWVFGITEAVGIFYIVKLFIK